MDGYRRGMRLRSVATALGVAVLIAGCDRAQEDRAAQNASEAVRSANQALSKAEEVAREGARESGEFARKAGEVIKEGAQTSGRLLSDGGLTARVKTALLADAGVSGTSIDVHTSGGVVTLSGRLANQAEIERALTIARSIEGVDRVENRLTAAETG
ncbi:MAG: BON domain-containing protein [Burkholderiales bacterium]